MTTIKKPDPVKVAADKAKAMKEYQGAHAAAVNRIATLRAARLARDAKAGATAKSDE
jgi:hypothetical protein